MAKRQHIVGLQTERIHDRDRRKEAEATTCRYKLSGHITHRPLHSLAAKHIYIYIGTEYIH